MNTAQFNRIYQKHIDSLMKEVEAYPDSEALWRKKEGINNPAGNLCLHLIGSLNHFVGTTLGHTGFVRNRESEFSETGLSKEELLKRLQELKSMMEQVLSKLSAADLEKEFPFDFAGKDSTEFYLTYFIGHFQYHMGQVNYHRRLLA